MKYLGGYTDDKDISTKAQDDYDILLHKPTIPTAISELTDDATHRTVTDTDKTNWNAKLPASSYSAADVLGKVKSVDGSNSGLDADLLDGLHASQFSLTGHVHVASDITEDTNNRFVTDTEKSIWNGKQNAGSYSTDIHSNIVALNAVSGTNTGDQTLTDLGILKNQSGANQTSFVSEAYLLGSAIQFPILPRVDTRYKLIFDVTKTAAGTATPIIKIRIGPNASTADASYLSFTFGAGTAVADSGIFEVIVSYRAIGASTAIITGIARLTSNLTTTGLSNAKKVVVATSATFDSTLADRYIGATYTGGASAVHTVTLVSAELIM